jgi:DNA-binding NarL/FixJ family response regulator
MSSFQLAPSPGPQSKPADPVVQVLIAMGSQQPARPGQRQPGRLFELAIELVSRADWNAIARQVPPLVAREVELLKLRFRGKSYREAAAPMGLTPRTVRAYSASVQRKLDARGAAQVILRILERQRKVRKRA